MAAGAIVSTEQKQAGLVQGLGALELLAVAVASGETSKAVSFSQPHGAAKVFAMADYAAADVWVSDLTSSGCTLNFADPTADKTINLLIAG